MTRAGFDANVADFGEGAVHLKVEEYASLILQHGNGAEYRRSILCPCARIESGLPAIGCKVCRGMGRAYPKEMRCPTMVLDSQRSSNMKWAAVGLMTQGMVTLSFPPSFVPGIGDIVLPEGDVHVVQETLWRDGSRRVDVDMYRDQRAVGVPGSDQPLIQRPGRDRLLYPETECIEQVAYLRKDGSLALPEDLEYKIEPDGTWRWLGSFGPEPGKAFTIRYRAPAAYMIHATGPLFRHENDSTMPYKVVAQRLDRLSADDLR